MKPSMKQTLVSAANSKDIDKISFGLRSLVHEEVDDDFREASAALLSGVAQIKDKQLESGLSNLTDSFRLLCTKIGQTEYLRLLADLSPRSAGRIHYYLSACGSPDSEKDHDSLTKIASWPDLSETSAKWLARSVSHSSAKDSSGILKPFLVHLAEKMLKGKMDAEEDEICKLVSGNGKLVEDIKIALQDSSSTDDKFVAGMILAVRFSEDEDLISIIGPYIESIGTWDHIVKLVLSKERTQNLFSRARELGLASSLQRLMEESHSVNQSLAELLSEDREFQRALAKLISTQSSFIAICRIFASSEMYTIMKAMFADSDAASRRAAALALSEAGGTSAIPFLKAGLVDKDKAVRQICSSAMQSILGEERFNEMLSEMRSETSFLAGKLREIAGFGEGALSSIRSGVSVSGKAVGDAATWIGDQAKGLLGGFKRSKE